MVYSIKFFKYKEGIIRLKVFKTVILLIFLFQMPLFALDKQLSESQQEKLLNWVNQNCIENHTSYESLSKDRYFICKKNKKSNYNNYPDGLYGTITFYEEGIDKRTIKEIAFFGALYLFLIIVGGGLFSFFKDTTIRKKYLIRTSSVFIVGVLILIGNYAYTFLKSYATDTLRNGNIEQINIALPIYNILPLTETPLVLTISGGSLEAVKYLIEEKKYDPNQLSINKYGNVTNPFDKALSIKAYGIVDYLKQYLPKDKALPISIASKSRDIGLLKKSIRYNKLNETDILNAFLISIEHSDYNAMEYLYNLSPSIINKKEQNFHNTPIYNAIQFNNVEAIKFLISKYYDINQCGTLSAAVYYDNVKLFEFLVRNGADINLKCTEPNQNPFIQIVKTNAKNIKNFVIDNGYIRSKELDAIAQKIDKKKYHSTIPKLSKPSDPLQINKKLEINTFSKKENNSTSMNTYSKGLIEYTPNN